MAPPRPEKIEQKRARELTKVIQLSPNTAAGGFRAKTRRASFAGRPPTPRRRFWRAIAPRLNLRGGMVVRTRARQTRRRTLTPGVNPMQPAQKSETAKRTSRTARPTRTRTHRRTERRSWHRSCWAATGRGSGGAPTATPNAAACSQVNSRTSDFCVAKSRRAAGRTPKFSTRGFFDRRSVFLVWGRWIPLFSLFFACRGLYRVRQYAILCSGACKTRQGRSVKRENQENLERNNRQNPHGIRSAAFSSCRPTQGLCSASR